MVVVLVEDGKDMTVMVKCCHHHQIYYRNCNDLVAPKIKLKIAYFN